MARNESDREDLMAEAVSLIRRIEYTLATDRSLIVAGFNALGWLFVYVGHDVMYRFDEECRLRRAFVDGLLYRTEGSSLSSLDRRRTVDPQNPDAAPITTLVRRTLSSDELSEFRQRMVDEIGTVLETIEKQTPSRQFPQDAGGIPDEVRQRLHGVLQAKRFLAPALVRR